MTKVYMCLQKWSLPTPNFDKEEMSKPFLHKKFSHLLTSQMTKIDKQ